MKLSPAARISMGLVALAVALVLVADVVLGFLPTEARWEEKNQLRTAEVLAIQIGVASEDSEALGRMLRGIVSRDASLLSIALRSSSGEVIAFGGEHDKHWQKLATGESRRGQFSIPMYRHSAHWGDVEIVFRSATESAWQAPLRAPSVQVAALLVTLGFIAYFLYLRKILQHLDPSSVVPDRVRMAFDVLTEGVMVLDGRGRVVLVNQVFTQLMPQGETVMGRNPSDLKWLTKSLDQDPNSHPWSRVMREGRSSTGDGLELTAPDGGVRLTVMNCAPILDAQKVVRGCLVTIDDITALHHANNELFKVLQALKDSQGEVERQNQELKRLVTRDPMTGCFNRRAFFESAEPLFQEAKRQYEELCCIMCDIDHFKRFNDQYGHSVGDQVIIAVAKALGVELRSFDLMCRYGGEEFCILLPNATPQLALEIAERLRRAIEANAGSSVRTIEGLKIASSFGVATLRDESGDLAGLIDQADEALYFSKEHGRNRVTLWQRAPAKTRAKTKDALTH